ncbi:MAG TPA: chromosome partitioning protein ParB [Eggerthellaceae bacterium]|nr:chromosome partitioning protein ParB [Eggerthellaceae bacterium]
MAKQRSGLGRGLDSLLGGDFEEVSATEKDESQVSREKDETVRETGDASAQEEVIYSSKEDNITIKGVVERKVPGPVAPPKKPPVVPVQQAARKDGEGSEGIEVNIDLVKPNPNQPRINFKKEDLEELAQSIRKNGLLQPILVRPVGDMYEIIAGERRWQACKTLGMEKVPIRIKEADDEETVILALIENIQRSDLNPIEEAYGYRRMMERGKMTQSEVAQAVSKGRTTITNALRLLELPEEAQQLLFEEKITAGHARAILSIPSKEGRIKLTDKLMEEKLSVRDAERIAKQIAGKGQKRDTSEKVQAPKSYKTVARALKDTLETDVKIKSVKGQNKIEISFKDEADLERLYRKIASQ